MESVLEVTGLLSPQKVRAIADVVRCGSASQPPSPRDLVDTPSAREAMTKLFLTWRSHPTTSAEELAGMLIGASLARRHVESTLSVELDWTGPTTQFVPTRRTEQVLLDLIRSADSNLFLVSFVVFEIPAIAAALNEAVHRGVRVQVLVEASSDHGGSLNVDPASKMRLQVPNAEVLSWRRKTDEFADGKVHAKVAVADGARAFITSANLTTHALERNMEAGVLVNGGALPKTLSDHLNSLIEVGVVTTS